MNIKFEVKMTKKAMFDFMLYTSYTSLSGIVGVIFGGVTLVLVMNLTKKESAFHRMNKVCLMNGEISERQFQPVSL